MRFHPYCICLIIYLLISITGISNNCNGQPLAQDTIYLHQEIDFARYLFDHNYNTELEQLLKELPTASEDEKFNNELNFLRGQYYFYKKELDLSAHHFDLITPSHQEYEKSKITAIYCLTYMGHYASADSLLDKVKPHIPMEYFHYQKAGLSLLQNDRQGFLQHSQKFSYSNYALNDPELKLLASFQDIKLQKRKSPLIAGLCSAILPGSGKVYGGKPKQGIAALLPITFLGLQFYENIHKRGWDHPLTYFYGGLFSLFYIGNIWGSALSVKITNDEWNEKITQKVLFNLHIPMRIMYPD